MSTAPLENDSSLAEDAQSGVRLGSVLLPGLRTTTDQDHRLGHAGKRDAAMAYATNGWALFPVYDLVSGTCSCGDRKCKSPGKHPRTDHGHLDATTDTTVVQGWWSQWPDANIGLPTSIKFDVLDLDGDDGRAWLAEMEAIHGPMPDGLRATTGRGGLHIFLKPTGCRNATHIDGRKVDFRGTGGYIVVAPSATVAQYEWIGDPFASPIPDAPEWLLAFLRKPATVTSAPQVGLIPYGARNDTLTRTAGLLYGRVPEGTREVMLQAAATFGCENPADDPISEAEVTSILRRAVERGWEPGPDISGAIRPGAGPLGVPLAAFLAESDQVSWAVAGMIVEGGLVQFLGAPESFKTFGMLHLGLAVASGVPWLGMATEARPFIYVSNEKARSTVRQRLRVMAARFSPVHPVEIIHREGVRFDRRWEEVVAKVQALGKPLVAIDTLASLSRPGFAENRSEDMSLVLGAIRELTLAGATVILAHHPAKAIPGSGRGHGSLDGEVDGTAEFSRPDKAKAAGTLWVRPKDEAHRRVNFIWNPETYLLTADLIGPALTTVEVAALVANLYRNSGQPIKAAAIKAEFPGHSDTAVKDHIREAKTGVGPV